MKQPPKNESDNIPFCDKIQLNAFNQIQPYGVLLVLDDNLDIRQCSENIFELLETSHRNVLNQSVLNFIVAILPEDQTRNCFTKTQPQPFSLQAFWKLPEKNIPIMVSIHHQADLMLLEIEHHRENHADYSLLLNAIQFNNKIAKNQTLKTVETVGKVFCDEIKKIFSYDRVLIYKFDLLNQLGLVVSEAIEEDMTAYVGLRFPGSDIPQSVREMYLTLSMRYIPTIIDSPKKIIPEISPLTQKCVELKNINLRMVAPVHVKYMNNMGICSALSIAILQDGILWGLIACHHRVPKYLSLNDRIVLMMFNESLSTQIAGIEATQKILAENISIELQTDLILLENDSPSSILNHNHAKWIQHLSAIGLSMYLDRTAINYGITPKQKEISALITWLEKKEAFVIYFTHSLPLEFEKSLCYQNKICGLLAIKITPSKSDYLLFYRQEHNTEVKWAGDPSKAITIKGSTYSPRDSFTVFLETISNESKPWKNSDLKWAELIHALILTKQMTYLENRSTHDPLTKLLNRYTLEETLFMEIKRASRNQAKIAILMIDVDCFKEINDTFGHANGDHMLIEIAHIIKAQFRSYDYIYRYGGDEFLVIITDANLRQIQLKASALRKKIYDLRTDICGSGSISISIGIALFPDHARTMKSLISGADRALYHAKKSGRNRVCTCVVGSKDQYL
jgi:diguanylate cyclase (GGDEF)-like protein